MDANKYFEISFAPQVDESTGDTSATHLAEVDRMATMTAVGRGGKAAKFISEAPRGNLIVRQYEAVDDQDQAPASTDPAKASTGVITTDAVSRETVNRSVDSSCAMDLSDAGMLRPRTCPTCSLGPCPKRPRPNLNPTPAAAPAPTSYAGREDDLLAMEIRAAVRHVADLCMKAKSRFLEVEIGTDQDGNLGAVIRRRL